MDKIVLPGRSGPTGMGWLPDRPDIRDLTNRSVQVVDRLRASASSSLRDLAVRTTSPGDSAADLPSSVDLREWCSPIEDQGALGSCTAHAGCGIVEYYQRRTNGRYVDLSRRFLYKVTRDYLGLRGDTGAYLRSTMGALALFGAPPEKYWTYDVEAFDEDPPAFVFAFAQSYQALEYFRLDAPGSTGTEVLAEVKSHLAAGIPAMFGFTVYASIQAPTQPGDIPFPSSRENVLGGHAVAAVGYDDEREVRSPTDGSTRRGAFLVRNSWGESWGEGGYGWMPYDYAREEIAEDWWALTQAEIFESGAFDE